MIAKTYYFCKTCIYFIYNLITLRIFNYKRDSSDYCKTTVVHKEIEHFNKFTDFWWKGNSLKGLHSFNKIRVPFIKDGLISIQQLNPEFVDKTKPFTEIRILDAGCGGGILTEALAKQGANIIGIDASFDAIEVAKNHAETTLGHLDNIKYMCCRIEEFSSVNLEKFDVVVSSEVVEHIDSVDLFIEHCIRVLKPGGSLFITTINRTIRSWLISIILREYILHKLPVGTHTWNRFITPDELENIVEKHNCKLESIQGWKIDNSTMEWKKVSDISNSYGIHVIKPLNNGSN